MACKQPKCSIMIIITQSSHLPVDMPIGWLVLKFNVTFSSNRLYHATVDYYYYRVLRAICCQPVDGSLIMVDKNDLQGQKKNTVYDTILTHSFNLLFVKIII